MATSNGFQLDKNIIDLAGQDGPGGVMPLSLPNTGRIYYDLSENKFKVSVNETAYVDLAVGGAGITTVGQPLTFNSGTGTLLFGTAAIPTTADATADVIWRTSATTQKGLVLQATASQTANVFEVQGSNGTVAFAIDVPSGVLTGTGNHISGAGAGVGLTSGNNNTSYGAGAGASNSNGSGNVCIGQATDCTGVTPSDNVVVGRAASTSNSSSAIAIGPTASVQSTGGIAIGSAALCQSSASIALGNGATATASNVFVAGGTGAAINNVYFGKGATDASPTAYTINGTGGSGTNIAGAALQLAGGAGTGTAEPGLVVLKYPLKTTTGTTLQTLSTQSYPVSTTMFCTTTSVQRVASVINTTETTLIGTVIGSQSLEGGLLRAGRNLRVSMRGSLTTSAAPVTFRIRVKVGSTAILDTTAVTPNANIASTWSLDAPITIRTFGAAGTSYTRSQLLYGGAANAIFTLAFATNPTWDMTATGTVDCTIQFGGNTAGNDFTLDQFVLEVLN